MSKEILTYAALAARLGISSEAARSLVRRLRLPRSLSNDGKALVSVDLDEIRHTARSLGAHRSSTDSVQATNEALQAEIASLKTTAVSHRADFERERERADRLWMELLKANAETMAAKEAQARLEGELATLRIGGREGDRVELDRPAIGGQGQSASRLRHLAATLVEEDRRACK